MRYVPVPAVFVFLARPLWRRPVQASHRLRPREAWTLLQNGGGLSSSLWGWLS